MYAGGTIFAIHGRTIPSWWMGWGKLDRKRRFPGPLHIQAGLCGGNSTMVARGLLPGTTAISSPAALYTGARSPIWLQDESLCGIVLPVKAAIGWSSTGTVVCA